MTPREDLHPTIRSLSVSAISLEETQIAAASSNAPKEHLACITGPVKRLSVSIVFPTFRTGSE
jgi:hypothetical protein